MAETISVIIGTVLLYYGIQYLLIKNIIDILFKIFTSKVFLTITVIIMLSAYLFPEQVIPYLQVTAIWFWNSILGVWHLILNYIDIIVKSVVN